MGGLIGNLISSFVNKDSGGLSAVSKLIENVIPQKKDSQNSNPLLTFSNKEDEVIARSMIEAAKADGIVTEDEVNSIARLLDTDDNAKTIINYLLDAVRNEDNLSKLVEAIGGDKDLAIKAYSSSSMLLHGGKNNPTEKKYLAQLADLLEIDPEVALLIDNRT